MKLQVVPPRTGILWVKLGVRTFLRQPLALAGLFFMYMTVMVLIAQIPFVGPVLVGLLVPAATLGLMAATAEAARGRFPMPTVLVSAFRAGRARGRAMLLLGVIYSAASLLATMLGSLAAGGTDNGEPQIDKAAILTLLLHTPLFLMFWHAPALVHWHGVEPVKSLFFSTVACWRNKGALLVYGMGWSLLFLVVGTLLGLIGGIAAGAGAAKAAMVPVALLMAAMFTSSIWFTFRDSFTADAPIDDIPNQGNPP